jgi:hypothetical protein
MIYTDVIKLLQFRVVDTVCAESEDHLGRQRVSVASDVLSETVWLLQKALEHRNVPKILVWDICFGNFDAQASVRDFTKHAPHITILLRMCK